MLNFTKDEKCAMIMCMTQIGAIQDSRREARTKIMIRYQDMLGIDTFELMEYTKSKVNDAIPTLRAIHNEKKKFYVQMMLAIMIEDGQITDSECNAFTALIAACRIPDNVVTDAMEKTLRHKL